VVGDGITAPDSKIERFAGLLATCQRPVFVYAMSLLHHAADAEEVLQETNLVLWAKFDEFQAGASFVRWACGIAHLEVLKLRAKQAREKRLFSDQFVATLAADCQQSVDSWEARRQALNSCLGKLRPTDRELILQRYQPKATTRIVARALGRSVQGTRKSLHRIRAALLACVRRSLMSEGQ
jgi:RNA polymerase sigma-70 factor, ECF subfamily